MVVKAEILAGAPTIPKSIKSLSDEQLAISTAAIILAIYFIFFIILVLN